MLLIFQAMDAASKDSTIKHVMSGVNPQGVQVHSFKRPSAEELHHDFLWRCARLLPEREHFEDIRAFESYLARNGYLILKFFLHVSSNEQKKRFLNRLDKPNKHWKFSAADVGERRHWDDYQRAYEDMIRNTAARHAPWYVVPADNKWYTRMVVAAAMVEAMDRLDLRYPRTDAARRSLPEE